MTAAVEMIRSPVITLTRSKPVVVSAARAWAASYAHYFDSGAGQTSCDRRAAAGVSPSQWLETRQNKLPALRCGAGSHQWIGEDGNGTVTCLTVTMAPAGLPTARHGECRPYSGVARTLTYRVPPPQMIR